MSRWLGCLTSLALIAATVPGTALAGGVFFGFGGSTGDVNFDSAFAESLIADNDSVTGEWSVGYRFDSKLMVEAGGSVGLSLDFFFFFEDAFSLSDDRVMVGYEFQPAERFSIIPKLGLSRWHLDVEDVTFLFFDDGGDDDFHGSGHDWIGRVSFEWHALERLRLYAAYTEAHYDFGDSSAPSFGFKFQF
jgi:outer membrane protein with beta-barrel domain